MAASRAFVDNCRAGVEAWQGPATGPRFKDIDQISLLALPRFKEIYQIEAFSLLAPTYLGIEL
jgi:hypothetical protein